MHHFHPRLRAGSMFALRSGRALLVGAILCNARAPLSAQATPFLVDTELTRTIQTTVTRHSPALAVARASVEAARARAGAAGTAPPLVLSGEVDDVPDGFGIADASFRLEVGREFLTGGRSGAERSLAAAELSLAEARVVATERRIEARALQRLARIVVLDRTDRRLAAEDSLLESAETALVDRFSVGGARYVDLLRVRTERLRVQTDRSELLADAGAERHALAGLAGPEGEAAVRALVDSVLALPPAVTQGTVPPPPPLDSLVALAGEIRVARVAVERAVAARGLALAEQRPRVAGAIGAQRRVEDGANSFGPVLSASVSLPFSRRRANRALVEAADREIETAEATLAATVAQVRAELAAVLTRYEAARERVAATDSALLQAALDEREAALGAYRSGDLSLLELLDFERVLARAEIERLRARADAAEAYANLISAVTSEG